MNSYPIVISEVSLLVEDLSRSIHFYREYLGMSLLNSSERKAVFTADGKTPLITIEQPIGVRPKEKGRTGLYHLALLYKNRQELANAVYSLIQRGYPLQGASDHLVSEAVYLEDPDGNGIELYADRPRENWRWQNNEIQMSTLPLDVHDLLKQRTDGYNQMNPDTIIGHIHLHVGNLEKAFTYYSKGLGLDAVLRYGNQALFMSTGGYHHHIGLNIWNGVGALPWSENSVGLKWVSLKIEDSYLDHVISSLKIIEAELLYEEDSIYSIDPSGNRIVLAGR